LLLCISITGRMLIFCSYSWITVLEEIVPGPNESVSCPVVVVEIYFSCANS